MSKAKAKVIVEYKGKRYRLHVRGKCGTKSCALFKKGVCDSNEMEMSSIPCLTLYNEIKKAGKDIWACVWKEVK